MSYTDLFLDKFNEFSSSFYLAPTYVKAIVFSVLIFALIISLAQFRHHFVKWSLKGGLIGLFFGFLFTVLIEGFLIINGGTFITSILGWNNAPKPFSTAIDLGKDKLVKVLGESSNSEKDVLSSLQELNPDEIKRIKAIICTP